MTRGRNTYQDQLLGAHSPTKGGIDGPEVDADPRLPKEGMLAASCTLTHTKWPQDIPMELL